METAIKFSIVIPVYNTPQKLLKKSVNSVLTQEYANKEIVLVDDGSSHLETLQCLAGFEAQGVVVLRCQNGGQATARNRGMNAVSGDYILFFG